MNKKKFVTFAFFQRGRGVATGLCDPSRVWQVNKIINNMPSYERRSEYRDMTKEDEELERQDQLVAAAKAPSKKRKRKEDAAAHQRLADEASKRSRQEDN